MKLQIIFGVCVLVFVMANFAEAQDCKVNSIITEKTIESRKGEFVYESIYKVKSLKIKFGLPYKIPAILEIYPISESGLEFNINTTEKRTNLIKKIASNEKFEFCSDELPDGNYLLRIGDSRGISYITFLRIVITEKGSKKLLVIR